jgi:CIC family chloride channel protein
VADICTTWPRLKVAFPDETLGDALATMGTRGIGRLPVVSREDPYHLLGMVRRQDIVLAYDLALTRRAEIQHRTQQIDLNDTDGTEFVEVILHQNDRATGQTVASIASQLPTRCVLISIKRDGKTIIPHGDTVFEAGDQITAFVDINDGDGLFHSLRGE